MDQANSQATTIDFQLRLASGPEGRGALIFDGAPAEAVPRFYMDLVEALFPPGRTGESALSIDTRGRGGLVYEAFGAENHVTISLREVPVEAASLVRSSLQQHGAITLLFGGILDGEFRLLDPVGNHIMRRMAVIDDDLVFGEHYTDWTPFLMDLRRSVPVLLSDEEG